MAHRRRHRIASSALSQRLEGSTDPALVVAPSGQSDSVSSWGHRGFRQSLAFSRLTGEYTRRNEATNELAPAPVFPILRNWPRVLSCRGTQLPVTPERRFPPCSSLWEALRRVRYSSYKPGLTLPQTARKRQRLTPGSVSTALVHFGFATSPLVQRPRRKGFDPISLNTGLKTALCSRPIPKNSPGFSGMD